MMEVVGLYQTSLHFHETTQCHISEYFNFPIILTVINTGMKIQVLWDVTLCCLASNFTHFEGIMILCSDGKMVMVKPMTQCQFPGTESSTISWLMGISVLVLLVFSSLHSV